MPNNSETIFPPPNTEGLLERVTTMTVQLAEKDAIISGLSRALDARGDNSEKIAEAALEEFHKHTAEEFDAFTRDISPDRTDPLAGMQIDDSLEIVT